MRIAVLTGGGDVPGLNPCIKAIAGSALDLGWTAVGCNLMPRAFSDMYRHCVESVDLVAAKNLYREILPVIDLVGQHRYVSATKKALELMGLPVGPPRPPRLPASGEDLAWTERVVRDLELTFR